MKSLPICAVLLIAIAGPLFAEDSSRPNVVLILADDLGCADLGCYGNTFNTTPHIDRLAKHGMRFTPFYAGPVCSPTRTNLQSGQDQARFGITQQIPGHRRPFAKLIDPVVTPQLPLEVENIAERLRDAGYATGYFGKWHLGGAGYGPQDQGWQTAIECQGHTVPPKIAGGTHQPSASTGFSLPIGIGLMGFGIVVNLVSVVSHRRYIAAIDRNDLRSAFGSTFAIWVALLPAWRSEISNATYTGFVGFCSRFCGLRSHFAAFF